MTSVPIKLRTGGSWTAADELGIGEPVCDPATFKFGIGYGGIFPRYYPALDAKNNMIMEYGTMIKTDFGALNDTAFGFEGENFVVRMNGLNVLTVSRTGVSMVGAFAKNDSLSAVAPTGGGLAELIFPLFTTKTLIAQLSRPAIAGVDSSGVFRTWRDVYSFVLATSSIFSRVAVATYHDRFGVRRLMGANLPRITYRTVSRKCRGLMIEPTVTNLLPYANDLTQWTATGMAVTREPTSSWSDRGLSVPYSFVEDSSNGEHAFSLTHQGSVVLPMSSSFYIQAKFFTGIRKGTLYVADAGRANLFGINFTLNGSTGVLTFDSNRTQGNGILSSYEIEAQGNSIYRVRISGTINPSGSLGSANNLTTFFHSLGDTGATALSFTATANTGSWCVMSDFQTEQFYTSTTFIPTTGIPVTRDADVLKISLSQGTFNFTPVEGIIEFGFQAPRLQPGAVLFSLQNSANTNRVDYYIASVDTGAGTYSIGRKISLNNVVTETLTGIATTPTSKSLITVSYANLPADLAALVLDGTQGFIGTVTLISYE